MPFTPLAIGGGVQLGSFVLRKPEDLIKFLADEIKKCKVTGVLSGISGPSRVPFTIEIEKDIVKYKTETQIKKEIITITPNPSGSWSVFLTETDNMENQPRYIFKFPTEIFRANVPDVAEKFFNDLPNLDRTDRVVNKQI